MAALPPIIHNNRVLNDVISVTINKRATTFTLNTPLDLDKVRVIFDKTKQPYTVAENGFPSLILCHLGTSVSVFESGKVVCERSQLCGVDRCVNYIVWLLRDYGVPGIKAKQVCVRNIVGSVKFNLTFDLDLLARAITCGAHRQNYNAPLYDINQFPGIQWELAKVKTTFLLFKSGEVVINGCRSDEDVWYAATFIHTTIQKCRIQCPGSVLPK
jgi:TATA-box binding protein (TBP) (component of TFIID and TFIIIB)